MQFDCYYQRTCTIGKAVWCGAGARWNATILWFRAAEAGFSALIRNTVSVCAQERRYFCVVVIKRKKNWTWVARCVVQIFSSACFLDYSPRGCSSAAVEENKAIGTRAGNALGALSQTKPSCSLQRTMGADPCGNDWWVLWSYLCGELIFQLLRTSNWQSSVVVSHILLLSSLSTSEKGSRYKRRWKQQQQQNISAPRAGERKEIYIWHLFQQLPDDTRVE